MHLITQIERINGASLRKLIQISDAKLQYSMELTKFSNSKYAYIPPFETILIAIAYILLKNSNGSEASIIVRLDRRSLEKRPKTDEKSLHLRPFETVNTFVLDVLHFVLRSLHFPSDFL